jgi:hypothetical protein
MRITNLHKKPSAPHGSPRWRQTLMALVCLTFIVTFGAATGRAQDPDNPNIEIPIANGQLRAFAASEVNEGAEHFNISAQTNNVAVLSRDDLVSISANVANVDQLTLSQLRNGADVGFIFVSSTRPNPFLATGFYLVRVFAFGGGDELKALVQFRNEEGNTVVILPAKVIVGSPFVAKSAVPVHTLTLGAASLGVGVQWNTTNGKSLKVSYTLPLDR